MELTDYCIAHGKTSDELERRLDAAVRAESGDLRAENEELRVSLHWALDELCHALGAAWDKNDWERYGPVVHARALLKGEES
ncbi:MAG: hypothetical protein ACE5IZ_01200 [Dehalococcoidia bacterium]